MIHLFFGDDSFQIKETVEEVARNFEEKKVVDGSSLERVISEGQQLFGQRDLFGRTSLFVFRNILSLQNRFFLKNLLENLRLFTSLSGENEVVFWQDGKPDKRLEIFKWLMKNAEVKEFKPLRVPEIREWIIAETEKLRNREIEKPIEPQAVEELIVLHGNNLWMLKNEIEKLIAYVNGCLITRADVKLLCCSTVQENIFRFCDAVGYRQKSKAVISFRKLLDQQQDVGYLFAMFIRQVRLLILAKEKGGLKNEHPFVQRKALAQTKFWQESQLKKLYQEFLEIDVAVKTGKKDLETEIFLLLTEL